jgi:lysine-ketoglutarate reductase/saccharopine dehydrogenase-like protein (TIGR00300 family)
MSAYRPPDFSAPPLRDAPTARFAPAPADGVLPEGFFTTTNLPTYVRVDGRWVLPEEPRMDGAIVRRPDGTLVVREGRRVRAGEPVLVGMHEDGRDGVFVHLEAFAAADGGGEFQFMSSEVSREKPIDYAHLARLLLEQRARGGHVVWVAGPAVVHSRARDDLTWFVTQGFVQVLMAGNAVAVHDIEAALYGTTLGMAGSGTPTRGGHGLHMRAINAVRAAGSIAEAVRRGVVTGGIMHACVRHGVPYVLCGSIRDDGPLPDVITDAIAGQDAMRRHAMQATMAVMVATALHAIATGNMLPSFTTDPDGSLRPLPTICVDASEFVVSKLKDRGTHQAFGVVTNAQDFLHVLRLFIEREEEARARRPVEASVRAPRSPYPFLPIP